MSPLPQGKNPVETSLVLGRKFGVKFWLPPPGSTPGCPPVVCWERNPSRNDRINERDQRKRRKSGRKPVREFRSSVGRSKQAIWPLVTREAAARTRRAGAVRSACCARARFSRPCAWGPERGSFHDHGLCSLQFFILGMPACMFLIRCVPKVLVPSTLLQNNRGRRTCSWVTNTFVA